MLHGEEKREVIHQSLPAGESTEHELVVDASSLQEDLQSLGFTLCLANYKLRKDKGGRRSIERDIGWHC